MVTIIWTEYAIEDLELIHEYIAQDSVNYANKLVDKIIDKVELLQNHPLLGRVVPEFEIETIRELIEGNYRIIYNLENDLISITRIHHASRLIKDL